MSTAAATRSCITPIDSIGNSEITTIEAIGATPAGAKIQKAWLDREVVAVRLLPVGPDHVGGGAAGEQPASDGCRHRRRDVRQHLPLRHLCPHSRSDQAGGAIELTGRLTMIIAIACPPLVNAGRTGLSRRGFLQAGAAVGGGLMLSLRLPFAGSEAEAAGADGFAPNAFIRIGSDGQVVLTMPYVEMGQGTYTSIPMLIAEELEVDLKAGAAGACSAQRKALRQPAAGGAGDRQLERDPRGLAAAAPGRRDCAGPCWSRLRQSAGMSIRRPAARKAARCFTRRADDSVKYGELAADAARMPVPENVALKRPQDFKLIGTPAKRLDTPAKVNGTAVYGIDVRPPGVKIATLAQSPVFGGRVKSVDDTAAKAVKGVRQIVRLDDAVAVVADHMGAAKKGLAALKIEWDDGPHAKLSTGDIAARARKGDAQFGAGRAEYR